MVKGMGWREKEGDGESPERGREGRKRRGEKERNLDSEYSAFPGWQNRRAQGGEKKKKKNCGKLTQSRIMAKSIKFDQVYYNEARLRIPSRDNEDRSQALEVHCSLCAWNMQQPAGSQQIITQYLCGSRKLPAQVECPCYIKRQRSEMFLMNIFCQRKKRHLNDCVYVRERVCACLRLRMGKPEVEYHCQNTGTVIYFYSMIYRFKSVTFFQ